MISPASIQEVMNRADVVEVIGQFLRLKKRGVNYIANCPFHNEKTPSFTVSGAKGLYKCFGCGKGGNVVSFVQEHEKLTYPEAIRWLADYYKIKLEETERTPEQQQQQLAEEALRILNEYAAQYFSETLLNTDEGQVVGGSYFKQRGFSKETIEKFRLGYNPESGEAFYSEAIKKGHSADLLEKAGLVKNSGRGYYDVYRGRVIFPIQSMTGRVLGFGARILKTNDRAPKYINTPENELYNKSRVLYGMYQSRTAISKQDECFLVEGYTDVISLHQGGVENVVASSGTSLTEGQLRLIGQLTHNLTILYDGDAAGVKAALRGLDMALSQSFNVKLVLLPEGEDPDSFIQKNGELGFREYVKEHKQDIINFRMDVGMKDVGDDPVRKSKLVNEIAESVARINKAEDFALQDYYIREAARRLQVDETKLVNLVNKYIRDRVENDRRQQERDKAAATPTVDPEQVTVETELTDYVSKVKPNVQQEWELVRVLIEHGGKTMAGYKNVAEKVYKDVDPDLIENELVRRIYDDYYKYNAEHGTPPDVQYIVNNTGRDVLEIISSVLYIRGDISHNWKDIYGIETLNGDMNYLNEVESSLAYFELKNLKMMQAQLLNRLAIETEQPRVMALVKKQLELKRTEAEIVKKMGTVILKLWKNQP
ncbi:DNA primase [Chitinophagaceae bacterium IBVUCB1]|nr:DNA primase [Chitinophagaceae bacterium IBVUCB1]